MTGVWFAARTLSSNDSTPAAPCGSNAAMVTTRVPVWEAAGVQVTTPLAGFTLMPAGPFRSWYVTESPSGSVAWAVNVYAVPTDANSGGSVSNAGGRFGVPASTFTANPCVVEPPLP